MIRREEIENSREYKISKAAVESYNNNVEDNDYISGFETGAEWADANPVHYDGKAYLYVLHKGVEQGRREMLENALDAYCKVCGHFTHDVPTHVCRLDCQYYKDFVKILNKE